MHERHKRSDAIARYPSVDNWCEITGCIRPSEYTFTDTKAPVLKVRVCESHYDEGKQLLRLKRNKQAQPIIGVDLARESDYTVETTMKDGVIVDQHIKKSTDG